MFFISRVSGVFGLLGASAALFLFPAQASAGAQTMIYDVYAGGLHAVQARLVVDTSRKGRYDLVLDAHTRGFLANLAPWKGRFETHGWAGDKGFQPELHKSTSMWRDEPEAKEYKYGKDGSFLGYEVMENGKDETEDVDPALTRDTTDALTGAMIVMEKVAEGGQCEGSSEVFDGDRRYRMTFQDQGEEMLEPTRYNVYQGNAMECTVEVEPLKGKWHEKPRGWLSIQEQGRARGSLPTMWLAQMEPGSPAVPIKIRVKTEYGTLFMHLAEYHNDEGVLVAQKRAEE